MKLLPLIACVALLAFAASATAGDGKKQPLKEKPALKQPAKKVDKGQPVKDGKQVAKKVDKQQSAPVPKQETKKDPSGKQQKLIAKIEKKTAELEGLKTQLASLQKSQQPKKFAAKAATATKGDARVKKVAAAKPPVKHSKKVQGDKIDVK